MNSPSEAQDPPSSPPADVGQEPLESVTDPFCVKLNVQSGDVPTEFLLKYIGATPYPGLSWKALHLWISASYMRSPSLPANAWILEGGTPPLKQQVKA